jgi:hypothetical protein
MSGASALLYPVMAQLLLTFVMMLLTGIVRSAALRRRRVRISEIALSGEAWPDDVKKISNNMHNQFETPILFYALCGIAIAVGASGRLMTLLAWAYVGSRVVHTAIHVTTNRVQHRFFVFAVGVAALMLMWLAVAAHLIGG